MPNIVMARSTETVAVPAGQFITAYTQDVATLTQSTTGVATPLGTVTQSQQTFGPFAAATNVTIATGANSTLYSIGAAPAITELVGNSIQRTPAVMNAAGQITFSSMASGLITSASTLGITCTLPAGASIEGMRDFKVDDSFDWVVIVIGLFGFTVGAATGHTVVGNATVATGTSGTFRTRKTAANTFTTYRIA